MNHKHSKPLSLLSYPFEVKTVRRILPNDLNLVFLANDFFLIGEPYKARMCIYYIAETRKGGYHRLDSFLRYLSRLCQPYGISFVGYSRISTVKRFGGLNG